MNYFDYAASSIIYPEVLEILSKSHQEDFANSSSQHILGFELQEKINTIKDDFKKSLGADKLDSVIFTSSATESNNTIIKGVTLDENSVVLYCKGDHPSVVAPVEDLKNHTKIILKEIKLNIDGTIDRDQFDSILGPEVKLVILTHVNNQSGVIQDLYTLSKLIKEKSSAHVHVDAVQSFGKINFKLNPFIDSMSFTAHKIGGPKGIAGLFLKKGHKVKPLLLGGGQEEGFRSSTVAYPLIAGFHQAMKIAIQEREEAFLKIEKHQLNIKLFLTQKVANIQFPFLFTSPYILSFIIPKISSDVILRHLEMRKVYISSTSACSSKITGFNPSLMALNIPERFHKNFLRISMGPRTTESEVESLINEFNAVWESLERML
jgi:cysteine desulfurase